MGWKGRDFNGGEGMGGVGWGGKGNRDMCGLKDGREGDGF